MLADPPSGILDGLDLGGSPCRTLRRQVEGRGPAGLCEDTRQNIVKGLKDADSVFKAMQIPYYAGDV